MINRGGVGVHVCTALINEEFERVFYKINYGLKITIMNLYMVCIFTRTTVKFGWQSDNLEW